MVQVFDMVRDKFSTAVPPAPSPPGFAARVPAEDADTAPGAGARTASASRARDCAGESVAGLTLIIEYRDGKGAESMRQISCIRIEFLRGERYLRAFCHTRKQQRAFRIDRIETVIDAETGETLTDGDHYFAAFADDRVSAAPMGWGLSVQQRARLAAGLNVLTFLSRCDGHCHPAERDEIDSFAASWWIRAGIAAPMPEAEIFDYARRLAPDAEAFLLAAQRVRRCKLTRPLVGGYVQRLIEADGRIAPEEHDWVLQLIDWWNEA